MRDVKAKQLAHDALYIVVCNKGYTARVRHMRFVNGISDPYPGCVIKEHLVLLPPKSRIYLYPCEVTRGSGMDYTIHAPAFVSCEKESEPAPVCVDALPELPDLNNIELPQKLPKPYRDLLNRYRKYGRGYSLKSG
jgi:hypothetical protein